MRCDSAGGPTRSTVGRATRSTRVSGAWAGGSPRPGLTAARTDSELSQGRPRSSRMSGTPRMRGGATAEAPCESQMGAARELSISSPWAAVSHETSAAGSAGCATLDS